jgi:hypothetical protein
MEIRKLSASAGAEWLLGGFGLLRKAPLSFSLLGAIYGALTLLVGMSVQGGFTLFMLLELAVVLLGPILVGGMVYAAREVDEGRSAQPQHLLQGLRDGHWPRLLATLLPQLAAMLLIVLLLAVLVGPHALAQMAEAVEKAQGQAKPDPALFAAIPFGRIALWLLLTMVIGILSGFFTFIGLPEIALTANGAWEAMLRSFRACLRNLPAMIVFFILTAIAVFAFYFVLLLVGLLVRVVAGDMAMQVVLQVLLMAVMMPVMTGAMYFAWKQMAGGSATTVAAPADRLQA